MLLARQHLTLALSIPQELEGSVWECPPFHPFQIVHSTPLDSETLISEQRTQRPQEDQSSQRL